MSVQSLLRAFALAGIPAGLVLGLVLGLPARRDDGWGGYSSFPRRASRLGHIAAVMLPALAGLYSALLPAAAGDGSRVAESAAPWGAALWIAGSVALPLTLFAAAWRRPLANLLPLPAMTVVAGGVLLAIAGCGAASEATPRGAAADGSQSLRAAAVDAAGANSERPYRGGLR